MPEGEIALADDVDELVLLGEVLELRDRVEDVPVRHGRGGGGEGVGVIHKERARLLIFLRRLGELELEPRPLELILARHGDGDLVGEAAPAVDGDGEGGGIQSALGGDLHHDGEGVRRGAVDRHCAAAVPRPLDLAQLARRGGRDRETIDAVRAELDGVHDGVSQGGQAEAALDLSGVHGPRYDDGGVGDHGGDADLEMPPVARGGGETEVLVFDFMLDISERLLLNGPAHGGRGELLDRLEELLLGDGLPGLPAFGGAHAHEDGPLDLLLVAELLDREDLRGLRPGAPGLLLRRDRALGPGGFLVSHV